jgi:hypothetical protein
LNPDEVTKKASPNGEALLFYAAVEIAFFFYINLSGCHFFE